LIGGCLADGNAIDFGIVTNDAASATGQAYVKFKTVASMFESKIERGGGIFGNQGRRASATMTE
jgi:hypothetical protein